MPVLFSALYVTFPVVITPEFTYKPNPLVLPVTVTSPPLILLFRVIAGIFVSAPNTLFVSMCLDISTTDKKVKTDKK